MKIVIDSTVLIGNFYMAGPTFRLLRWFLHNQPSELVVPQVVLEEVKTKYRDRADKNYSSALSAIGKLNSHLRIDFPELISQEGLQEKCQQYNIQLNEALQSLKARIIPYKDIPHVDIVKRDLTRIKPFRKVGKKDDSAGYRDALIWESILRYVVPKSDKVIFISANISDFYDKGSANRLHSHLEKDLEHHGYKQDHIIVCKDVTAFVNEHVKPLLPAVSTSVDSSLAQHFVSHKDKIEKLLLEYFIGNKGEVSRQLERRLGLPFDISSEIDMLTIRGIGDFDNFSVVEAHEINDELINVKFEFQTYFELEFYAHNYFPDYDSELPNFISVEEYEEDKYGAWLLATMDLPMEGSLTLNIVDNSVQDIEGSFPEVYGFCPRCGDPITHDAAESCYSCNHRFF